MYAAALTLSSERYGVKFTRTTPRRTRRRAFYIPCLLFVFNHKKVPVDATESIDLEKNS